jgi:hypothetical protein
MGRKKTGHKLRKNHTTHRQRKTDKMEVKKKRRCQQFYSGQKYHLKQRCKHN